MVRRKEESLCVPQTESYHNRELDGMPGATVSYTNEAPEHNYRIGFPFGFRIGNLYYLNNHVVIQVLYEKSSTGKYNIMGFEVYPDS